MCSAAASLPNPGIQGFPTGTVCSTVTAVLITRQQKHARQVLLAHPGLAKAGQVVFNWKWRGEQSAYLTWLHRSGLN